MDGKQNCFLYCVREGRTRFFNHNHRSREQHADNSHNQPIFHSQSRQPTTSRYPPAGNVKLTAHHKKRERPNQGVNSRLILKERAAARRYYTAEESKWLRQHRRKVKEATDIYQVTLLEGIHFESRVLRLLTVALIVLTGMLATFAYPSFIAYLRLIGWLK